MNTQLPGTNPQSPGAGPPAGVYLAVFLVSLSVLVFEISTVRLFSVLFRYHYVFEVVSFSILGLGVGALLARNRGTAAGGSHTQKYTFQFPAIGLGMAQAVAVLLVFFSPLLAWFSPLVAVCLILLLPFCLAGWFLASVFQLWPETAGKLYGADLAGASVGCLACIGLLNALGPVNTIFVGAMAASVAGLFISLWKSVGILILMAGLFIWNVVAPFVQIEKVPLRLDPTTTKPMILALRREPEKWKILASSWDAFTRTDALTGPNPDVRWIYTDGDTPTQMLKAGSV